MPDLVTVRPRAGYITVRCQTTDVTVRLYIDGMGDAGREAADHAPLFSPADFGHFIRAERHRQGFTQAELAARLGVSRKWLSEAENGKPTIEVGLAMAALRELGHMLRAAPRPEPEFDIDAHLEALRRRD